MRLHTGRANAEFYYAAVEPGLTFIKSRAKLNFLGKFHKLIQISASHYTLDGDSSERLMLKYYEYQLRIRALLNDSCGISVLANLESFPVDLDPSLREYHEKIADRIDAFRHTAADGNPAGPLLHSQDPPVLRRRTHLLRGDFLPGRHTVSRSSPPGIR
ncbi:hypothetical protein [Jidongwangia harbinensis]|uniref:hypothetical protein n=1 Tax=Jidongwangia harbinensis TaxID=2878561 RepID=UPI001CD9911E|nr:hypothetical protein [Jidongwangia harbinensis]MCA2218044.1 hypothetical protein [Jidongwangia harbinensis]